MDREQFEQEFNLFHQDFLNVIQNSGENNVDFNQFTALVDELIGVAVKRTNALGKIKKVKQVWSFEDDEITEITDDESQSGNEDEDNFTFDKVVDEVVVDVSEVNDEIKEVVVDVSKVNDEIKEVVPEVKTISNEVKTFSTNLKTFDSNFKTFSTDVKIFSTDVETLSNEVEVVLDQITNAEAKQPKPDNKVVVADVANEVEEAPIKPKKVKHNFVDAAPIVNKYNDNESSDNFRFRPRRRKNR
jgi:septation ring formation regulator EzrA